MLPEGSGVWSLVKAQSQTHFWKSLVIMWGYAYWGEGLLNYGLGDPTPGVPCPAGALSGGEGRSAHGGCRCAT